MFQRIYRRNGNDGANKKYRLWIAYSGIWILNFFLFWLVEIIMYYTMQSVIRMNQADNFLKTIYHYQVIRSKIYLWPSLRLWPCLSL